MSGFEGLKSFFDLSEKKDNKENEEGKKENKETSNKKILGRMLGSQENFNKVKDKPSFKEFLINLPNKENNKELSYSQEDINKAMSGAIEKRFDNSPTFSKLPVEDKKKIENLKAEFIKDIGNNNKLELGEQFKKFDLIFESINGIEGAINASYEKQNKEYQELLKILDNHNSEKKEFNEKIKKLTKSLEPLENKIKIFDIVNKLNGLENKGYFIGDPIQQGNSELYVSVLKIETRKGDYIQVGQVEFNGYTGESLLRSNHINSKIQENVNFNLYSTNIYRISENFNRIQDIKIAENGTKNGNKDIFPS
ncbi:hypothetical protein KAZ01_02055 [Candidatus Gracilibacteria bacterium]|nr:hypothetical protein [Candidatus Gracilibacteria bacterium]